MAMICGWLGRAFGHLGAGVKPGTGAGPAAPVSASTFYILGF